MRLYFSSPLSLLLPFLSHIPLSCSKGYDIEDETVPLEQDDALPLIETIANAADMRKGEDVYAIRVSSLTTVSSFFVLVSGNSRPQIQAIAGTSRTSSTLLLHHYFCLVTTPLTTAFSSPLLPHH